MKFTNAGRLVVGIGIAAVLPACSSPLPILKPWDPVGSMREMFEEQYAGGCWGKAAAALATEDEPVAGNPQDMALIVLQRTGQVGSAEPQCAMETGDGIDANVFLIQKLLAPNTLADGVASRNLVSVARGEHGFLTDATGQPRTLDRMLAEPIGRMLEDVSIGTSNTIEEIATTLSARMAVGPYETWTDSSISSKEGPVELDWTRLPSSVTTQGSDSNLTVEVSWAFPWSIRDDGQKVWSRESPRMKLVFRTDEESMYQVAAEGVGAHMRKARIIDYMMSKRRLEWRRPPGVMRLELFNPRGDHAYMRPLEVKAGYTYRIEYSFTPEGVSFDVSVSET